ncbi:hypothetical protein BDZ45DRAFT_27376 [Acephala macrosclerotiorum]|nr:hypothetical protein BDZ45DRAFT_27376 [Acephala macrosclerotiorum]
MLQNTRTLRGIPNFRNGRRADDLASTNTCLLLMSRDYNTLHARCISRTNILSKMYIASNTDMFLENPSVLDIPLDVCKNLRSRCSPAKSFRLSDYPKQSNTRGMLLFVFPMSVSTISLAFLIVIPAGIWTVTKTLHPIVYLILPLLYITIC